MNESLIIPSESPMKNLEKLREKIDAIEGITLGAWELRCIVEALDQKEARVEKLEAFLGAAIRWRDALQKASMDRPCDLPLITEIEIITR